MKKILFLLNSVDIGGIETYVLRFLKKSNLKVDIITKSGNLGELEKYYDDLGIKVIPMKLNNLSVSGLFKFFRHLKQERYDVVCDFTGTFSGVFLVLAFFARVSKRIVFFRNSSNSFERTLFKVLLEWILNLLTFLGSTKILSNSQAAINNHYPILRRVFNKKFEVIRNGVPTLKKLNKNEVDEFKLSLGIPLDKFIVGHVGRFSSQKNQKSFIKLPSL